MMAPWIPWTIVTAVGLAIAGGAFLWAYRRGKKPGIEDPEETICLLIIVILIGDIILCVGLGGLVSALIKSSWGVWIGALVGAIAFFGPIIWLIRWSDKEE